MIILPSAANKHVGRDGVESFGTQDLLGVRFRPGEASRFVPAASARELRDRLVPLRDLWGSAAADLADQLAASATLDARLALLEAALAGRPLQPVDFRVRRAVRTLHGVAGVARIEPLAASVGMGARQLERLFDQRVGLGPKGSEDRRRERLGRHGVVRLARSSFRDPTRESQPY